MKSYSPAHPARLWRMANGFLSSSKQTAWKCKSWFGLCPECWTNSTCLTCKQLQNLIFTQGFTEMRKDCFYFLDDSLWFKRELIWENPLVCVVEHARLNDDSRLFFFLSWKIAFKVLPSFPHQDRSNLTYQRTHRFACQTDCEQNKILPFIAINQRAHQHTLYKYKHTQIHLLVVATFHRAITDSTSVLGLVYLQQGGSDFKA